ncbi:hypothetical protein BCR42DRAFT_412850 [Absidia repens]|uniref:Uncharacterized protein n=1 Tax=Absidia repens TaxID=90262 RepID=A0A1X2IKA6_9FUNG|nr:hypothetical protein BCR42DRAFT_412850 [Absidia repens]
MTTLEIADILENLSQLDTHLFKATQQSLEQDLSSFVVAFDGESETTSTSTDSTQFTTDDLALAFIQLNNCQTHLDLAKKQKNDWNDLSEELDNLHHTVDEVRDVIKSREQRETQASSPLEEEKKAFMCQLQQQRREYDQDLQRQFDKMEENHVKKTRDSIYRNLVGSNVWLNG